MQDRDDRRIDLAAARADGWYERVVAAVPALERLANNLGDGLVALALAGGFRLGAVQTDRITGLVSELSWTRERYPIDSLEASERAPEGAEVRGTIANLRTSVLAALVGDAEPSANLPDGEPDAEALRAFIGARSSLLAPLFGLSMRELRYAPEGESRVLVGHDGIEEVVALKQLRRFLRQRVVEVLQGESGRGQVAIELAQADFARVALDEGRPEETVARLVSWLAPLSVFHRTAEGQSLDRATRARLARALGTLAEAYSRLRRVDERNEVLRLSLQYALDGDAAPDLYLALARSMIDERRDSEAIGPLRRALSLGGAPAAILPLLGGAFARSGRTIAALACVRALRAQGVEDASLDQLVRDSLGSALATYDEWMEHKRVSEPTATMPALVLDARLGDERAVGEEATVRVAAVALDNEDTVVNRSAIVDGPESDERD